MKFKLFVHNITEIHHYDIEMKNMVYSSQPRARLLRQKDSVSIYAQSMGHKKL